MFVLGMGQTLFLINVPLFLILTGYLNLNKKISKAYYKNGIRVIISYLLISVITIVFRRFYLHEELSWIQWVLKITDFTAIPYGWYIEMWIGLFVLTPFLNILWDSIETKQNKHLLLLTLYCLCALPDCFNRYGVHLVPGFWESLYPVCYFYIGAYVKEYNPQPKKSILSISIIGLCLINPMANLIIVHGSRPMMHLIGSGVGIVGIPFAALFFIAIYDIDIRNRHIKSLLARISILSLDMYLISYVFDELYYGILRDTVWFGADYFLALFIVVIPLVFVSSYIFAEAKDFIFKLFSVKNNK